MASRIIAVLLMLGCFVPQAQAKYITIAMGTIEPYFIAKDNSGIFTDLISAVFAKMPDHEPVFRFGLRNNVRWNLYERGKVEAVANIFDSVEAPGCRTDKIFRFNDVAITRKDANISLKSWKDLAGKEIISFEGATGFFGEEYSSYLTKDKYHETSAQASQARLLITKRVDVSVGDLFIFLNALKDPLNEGVKPSDFDYHPLFERIATRMAFRDETICPLFNKALAELQAEGGYEMIYRNYFKRFEAQEIIFTKMSQ